MFQIKKLRADHVIDFAAEELKKYLRMMMPHCNEIPISYEPGAKDGFRLGLLEDFGLPFEGEDPVLDDVIHVDTEGSGGILAGSNMRSVLFAVYRMLRENGCRWLYPGVDGEYIPAREIGTVRYHKLADHRFRGHCNEGAESQQAMLDTIDFYAKLEINVYMLEFDIPFNYYDRYYSHPFNEENRPPEPVSHRQISQWKRQCEAEIAKRGLQFHDMGHGWTAEPFGLSTLSGWTASYQEITAQQREHIAMLGGVRELFGGVAMNTNLCMSNPKTRTIMAKSIVDYAKNHRNVDYLHVWLADGKRNHCECEACQKARPSDFYLMIMNEVDELLTQAGLDTRIVFIAYVDTMFAPRAVEIRNPRRFSLLYAPITRSYCASIRSDSVIPEPPEYQRNQWEIPKSTEENLAFLRDWQKNFTGPGFSYEYHFWKHQCNDPSGLYIARRIYEDIRSLKYMNLSGYVEDGSQRSFFPNGFAMYIYAETLMNRDCDFDAVAKDYFSHAYGEDWPQVLQQLRRLQDTLPFPFMAGEASSQPTWGSHYNPEQAVKLQAVEEIAAAEEAIAMAHMNMPYRCQTASMRLLRRHAEYIRGIADFMGLKARGKDEEALESLEAFRVRFGAYEIELERYFDHFLAFRHFRQLVDAKTTLPEEAG